LLLQRSKLIWSLFLQLFYRQYSILFASSRLKIPEIFR
jgi:hypothetical protein